MKLSENPGAVKQFRKKGWKFQQTFLTPLKDLPPFVKLIIAGQKFRRAHLTIDQAVFEPKHLIELMESCSVRPQHTRGTCLTAEGEEEIASLLESALSDWVDFIFIPEPRPFAIFADHDEYTTFLQTLDPI